MKKHEFEAMMARAKEVRIKSEDMDTLISAIMKLPYGQLKKVLSDEVLEVLAKYGYNA